MRGFGRYFILNQAHAQASAQKAPAKEIKDASREVKDRSLERRDRDQAVRKVERAEASPSVVDMFNLRPSRPMSADSWSIILPNGPAPGESETGYIARRRSIHRRIGEERKSAHREADATLKAAGDADPIRRNKKIQAILTRRAAAREILTHPGKEAGKDVDAGDE